MSRDVTDGFIPHALKHKQYVHILPPTNGTVCVLVHVRIKLMLCRFIQSFSAALMTDHVR